MLKLPTTRDARTYLYLYLSVYVYMHVGAGVHKHASVPDQRNPRFKPKSQRQNGRQAKIPTTRHASTSVQCTQHLQTRENERRRTCSPRETTKVFAVRDDKRVHRERQRTSSPRESPNVFTAREDERVHCERRRMCSAACPSSASRCCNGK